MDRKENKQKIHVANDIEMRFLVCNISDDNPVPVSSNEKWVNSPVKCLDCAVEWEPQIIVISFINISIAEREALIELCAMLKRNSLTENCIVAALLSSRHRRVVSDLVFSKIDHISYLKMAKPDSTLMLEVIRTIKESDTPVRQLKMLCPFLKYISIDSRHEMTVCGAWHDRMVLGGKRLLDLCETENHMNCEYFFHQGPQL